MAYTTRLLPLGPRASLAFLVRRLRRIVPLYWILTATLLLLLSINSSLAPHVRPTAWNSVASFLFIMSRDGNNVVHPVLNVGWTLNFEMIFYGAFAVCIALRRRPLPLLLWVMTPLAIGSLARESNWPAPLFLMNGIVLEFCIGVAVADYCFSERLPGVKTSALLIVAGGLVMLLVPAFEPWRFLAWGVPAGAVVLGTVLLERRQCLAAPLLLVRVGDASYSTYLIHPFIVPLLAHGLRTTGMSPRLLLFAELFLSLLISLLAGKVVYNVIERPILGLLRGPAKNAAFKFLIIPRYNARDSLLRNSAIYTIGRLSTGIFGIATTISLTHTLMPGDYGRYGLILALATFGSNTLFDWLNAAFQRFHDLGHVSGTAFSTVVKMMIIIAIVAGGAALACSLWLPASKSTLLWTAFFVMLAVSYYEIVARVEIVEFRPTRYLVMNCMRGLLTLAAASTTAAWTRSPEWTAVAAAAGILAGSAFSEANLLWRRAMPFNSALARQVVIFGIPVVVTMTLGGIVTSVSRVLLETLDSSEALGLYTAAFLLVQNTLTVLGSGVAAAAFPLALRVYKRGDSAATTRQVATNGTLLLAMMAPACTGMALMAHSVSTSAVGHGFSVEVEALIPWMAGSALMTVLRTGFIEHIFLLTRQSGLQTRVAALAACVTLLLAYTLIPVMGVIGAAIATTVAATISCLYAAWLAYRRYGLVLPIGAIARVGIACIVMSAATAFMPADGLKGVICRAGLGSAVYLVLVLCLNICGLRARLIDGLRPLRNAQAT